MNILMMVFLLFAMYGIMSLHHKLFALTPVRGFALSVVTVIGAQAVGGLLGRTEVHGMSYSVLFLILFGMLGHILVLSDLFKRQNGKLCFTEHAKEELAALYCPAVIGAGLIFLLALFIMRGMLIYRYDDLKQWGAAAKFMTEYEWMPREEEFFGSHNHYLTPTFFTSFFGIGGKWVTGKVVEHNFYAANMLFVAAGLILPLGEIGWKDYKKVFTLLAVELLGMTALYYHSIANLYVDITLAAWVSGLLALAVQHRVKGKTYDSKFWRYYAVMLLFTVFIKWGYGILGVCIILLAMFITAWSVSDAFGERIKRLFANRFVTAIVLLSVLAVIVLVLGLSVVMGELLNKILPGAGGIFTAVGDILFARTDKAVLTLKACLTGLFDQPVTRGFFGYGALVGLLLVGGFGAVSAAGHLDAKVKKLHKRLNLIWMGGSIVWFLLILFVYVSNFAYAEATIALSFNRYMGIYLMIGFFVQVVFFFTEEHDAHTVKGLSLVLFAVLLLNINTDLVVESTALDTTAIVGYENVQAVKAQSEKIKAYTTPEDDILYIGQYGAERGLHRARVDVGMNISSFKPNTYKFAEGDAAGYDLSITRAPGELPQLIIDGGYEYVWVYKSNAELNNFTESYFGFRFDHAMLYRVEIDGNLVYLKDGVKLTE